MRPFLSSASVVCCRRCSLLRFLLVLVLFLAVILTIHLLLVGQLPSRNDLHGDTVAKVDHDSVGRRIIQSIKSSQVMDSSGHYTVVNNVIKSKPPSHFHLDAGQQLHGTVTLVSQCSANHLRHVLDMAKSWQGPISVAVFTTYKELGTMINSLTKLAICYADLLRNTSLHLVYALAQHTHVRRNLTAPLLISKDTCENMKEVWADLQTSGVNNYASKEIPYPTNLLRNVALANAVGEYVFVIDIDMLPNSGLYFPLVDFLRNFSRNGNDYESLQAFVIPAFEMHSSVGIPRSKQDLLEMWKTNQVRPFYQELCWKCQKHTNYSMWRDLPHSDSLHVAFSAVWKDPWEPFYVVPKSAPKYDERFKQYGFNRISQSCELHITGFQFSVLDNAFLVHRGFKTNSSFHESKELEQNQNRMLFRKFKEELKVKYPDSKRRCY